MRDARSWGSRMAVVVAVSLWAAGCGGGPKPPMVPDAPPDPSLMADAGADMPSPPPAPAKH